MRPPRGSDASYWDTANDTNTVCKITCQSGAIVDIHLDWIGDQGGSSPTVWTGSSGLTAGNLYFGYATSDTNLARDGVTSTTIA